MGRFKNLSKAGLFFGAVLLVAFSLLWVACSEKQPSVTAPEQTTVQSVPNLARAAAVQRSHTERLMDIDGVEGVGLGLSSSGKTAIKVFTSKPNVAGLPKEMDGLPVEAELTGKFFAFAAPLTGRYRPVPIGVSVASNSFCAAGTIGCIVERANKKYILSNNHVLARENLASIGEDIVQPGRYDNKPICANHLETDKVADLSDFVPLKFDGSDNLVDAAIGELSTSDFTCATLPQFYGLPGSTPVEATLGLPVKKVGRTSVLTTGTVIAVNATVNVNYGAPGVARFVGQIVTSRHFIKSGDSGSLMVTDDANNDPVGLLFAGTSDGIAIANPIDEVLKAFHVSICGD
ncbi:MAG: S1 family peptidase [candidate division Zixibacteria bacterium]|nr:S1 family peptidase [candidate division Zixibacteria bacterium]